MFYTKAGAPTLSNPAFEEIYRHILTTKTIKKVLISVDWGDFKNLETLQSDLEKTIDILSANGREVIVIDGVPMFPFDPIRCKGIRFPHARELCLHPVGRLKYEDMLDNLLDIRPMIRKVHTKQYFCKDGMCGMVGDEQLLYRDDNHLNINGSRYIARKIKNDYPTIFD